jgi:hypothetical protein
VLQLVAGRMTVQRVAPPDAKTTVPVAPPGRPASASAEVVPYVTFAGVALAVKDVARRVTVSDVVAVDPA